MSRMARQRAAVSGPGWQPDLASSPEVLTWTWTLSFGVEGSEARRSPRDLFRSWAFLRVSTLETQKRFGTRPRGLQWPGGVS